MIITAANRRAENESIGRGMVLADATAIVPDLQVLDDIPDLPEKYQVRFISISQNLAKYLGEKSRPDATKESIDKEGQADAAKPPVE